METKREYSYQSVIQMDDAQTASRKYLAKVFAWMFAALLISAFCAYEFGYGPLQSYIVRPLPTGAIGLTGFGSLMMWSPLAFSLVMSFGFNRLSYPALIGLFIAYSICIGVSLSILAFMYAAALLFKVFIICAVVFGIMAIAGFVTKTDLSRFGSILIIGMFGIVAASVINMIFKSSGLDYIIGYIGVAVFVGLTAYYVQMLKRIGEGDVYGNAPAGKLVIMGAFMLYTTFINLFISLLSVFGRDRR